MNTVPSLQMLAQVSADQLVNCLQLGLAIAFLAWAFLRLNGRTGSVTRFAVWFAALLTIAVLPVAGVFFHGVNASDAVSSRAALTLPHSWALYLFLGWAVIAMLSLFKVGAGLFRLLQLRRSCTVVGQQMLDPLLRETLRDFQSKRSVVLCTSESLHVPAAIGFFRPAVVFPSWAMEELTVSELNSILLHELAHLARWDDWTNLAQKILRGVLFFHPAVWWIDSRLTLEREMACDDIVLACTANPRAYAECLVSLTEKGLLHRGYLLVQAAISRVHETTLRVKQILDRRRPTATSVRKPAFSLLATAAIGCSLVAPLAPHLVSFESGTPPVAKSRLHSGSPALLVDAAYHSESPSKSNSPDAPRLTNAAFQPDEVPQNRSAVAAPKRVNLAPRKAVPAAQKAPLRVAVSQRAVDSPAVTEEVVLVVMQQRTYDMNGQSMFSYSIYRFVTFVPGSDPGTKPRKI